jgi:hypothetical protein
MGTPAYAVLAKNSMKTEPPQDDRWNRLTPIDKLKLHTPGQVLNALARSPSKPMTAKELLIRASTTTNPGNPECQNAGHELRTFINNNRTAGFKITHSSRFGSQFWYTPAEPAVDDAL